LVVGNFSNNIYITPSQWVIHHPKPVIPVPNTTFKGLEIIRGIGRGPVMASFYMKYTDRQTTLNGQEIYSIP